VSFGSHSFTDLDFADDVALLAKLLELLVPALEMMASEAASLWLEVKCEKTKSPSSGHQGGHTITNHSSWSGDGSG